MHILLIHQAFAALDEPGGTRHHELARYLAGRGHRLTIIASPVSYLTGEASHGGKDAGSRESRSGKGEAPGARPRHRWVERQDGGPGVTVVRAYTYPALHRSFVHRVFSFLSFMFSSFLVGLSVRGVDVVWGTSPPIFQGGAAWALARLKRVPFLFEVRDLWPAFAVAVGVLRRPLLIRAVEAFERFLYRHADRVMVNSPGFIDHVRNRGARRVDLVPNGADPRMYDPAADGADFRKAHGLEGRFVILYAGAHGLSNDLGVVLEAASCLRDRPDLRIVLLGDGKEKPALLARAAGMGLENLLFVPPVPKTAMPAALAAADACLAILKPIPLYATVYPNKVFDYLAAGRPVLLAIDGVIRSVVESARAGVFVPPGDPVALAAAIDSLAADPARARELGWNGRRYIEAHFDRARLAEDLLVILEELVKKSANLRE